MANVLLLRVHTTRGPRVPEPERFSIEEAGDGIYRGLLQFGFVQNPDVGAALRHCLPFKFETAVFFMPQMFVGDDLPWWPGLLRLLLHLPSAAPD